MSGMIKVYKSTDAFAKKITGQAGSLIAVLDDVLVLGYGSVQVNTVTKTDNIATIATASAHGLNEGDICKISGADQSNYNGEFKVHILSTTTFTIPIPNEAPSAVTGTISCVKAPLGFTKAFAGTNKAAYRANDVNSNRFYLRVVDDASGTRGGGEAALSMYEVMTSVDTGDLQVPSTAKMPTTYVLAKSTVSDTSIRHWMIIGDSKRFYMFVYVYPGDTLSGVNNISNMIFGDVVSNNSNDAWATVLGAHPTTIPTNFNLYNPMFGSCASPYSPLASFSSYGSYPSMVFMRDFNGAKGGRLAQCMGCGLTGSSSTLGNAIAIYYPNSVDGGLYLIPVILMQAEPVSVRGRLPGVYDNLHGRCMGHMDIIDNVDGFPGRSFMMVYGNNVAISGSIIIDITGPWE